MTDPFVRVRGTQFTLGGRPYRFVGTNMWSGCYLGSPGPTGRRECLCRDLDVLRDHGITNIRVMASSENSASPHAARPPVLRSPDDVDEDLLQGLDFLLAEMAARDMRAVLYLTNFWDWSGGMAAYNDWAGGGAPVVPPSAGQSWSAYVTYAATFYANAQANALYRAQIARIVGRTNTVNGRIYRDDPAIMAWQLANEPRPGLHGRDGEQNLPHFFRWLDETAAYVHTLDGNHLVSTGSEGTEGCLGSGDHFLRAHAPRHIDYLTFHLWPFNWGWFDPQRQAETLPEALDRSRRYVQLHTALAERLGRPLVLEEFGLSRDHGAVAGGATTTARDAFYAIVTGLLDSAARSGAPLAGSNFWTWGGEKSDVQHDTAARPADRQPGDPPHEPQGFNAVYGSDVSTLAILRGHAEALRTI